MKATRLLPGMRIFLTLLFAVLISSMAWSQILEPVKWSFSSEKTGDNEALLTFRADIETHWHLYSQDIPMAPPATTFYFEGDTNLYELVGEVTESEYIEEFDPNFDMVLKYFSISLSSVVNIVIVSITILSTICPSCGNIEDFLSSIALSEKLISSISPPES